LVEEYGAWESRRIIDDFTDYCITLYKRLGDRVRYWVSLNEQNYNFHHGFLTAMHPPGVKDRKRFYEANHIAFLANARAIEAFRQYVPGGKIGPSVRECGILHERLVAGRLLSRALPPGPISLSVRPGASADDPRR
jgi:beta-glucosidase/6-phospho-beta-glucosidase/beta-galactosidase